MSFMMIEVEVLDGSQNGGNEYSTGETRFGCSGEGPPLSEGTKVGVERGFRTRVIRRSHIVSLQFCIQCSTVGSREVQ